MLHMHSVDIRMLPFTCPRCDQTLVDKFENVWTDERDDDTFTTSKELDDEDAYADGDE
jgi:DICT domain-containing protein